MEPKTTHIKAIGLTRYSDQADRRLDRLQTIKAQKRHLTKHCEDYGWTLIRVDDETDDMASGVSGAAELEDRPKLRAAIEAVERRKVNVILFADSSRAFRDTWTQHDVVERVEAAGGEVWAVKAGRLTYGTAADFRRTQTEATNSQAMRMEVREKTWEALVEAVALGRVPWPNVEAGYTRQDDGTFAVDPKLAPVVAGAFERRANGDTVAGVRQYLKNHGVNRTYHGVQVMLSDRCYLGEIHWGRSKKDGGRGTLHNPHAHPAIVDKATFDRVQRRKSKRGGSKPKQPRLLSGLGVLRCGTCGRKMTVTTTKDRRGAHVPFYRCSGFGPDCERRISIKADTIEEVVTEATLAQILPPDFLGDESPDVDSIEEAQATLDAAQAELDQYIRVLSIVSGEQAAVERLEQLTRTRDDAADALVTAQDRKPIPAFDPSEWDEQDFNTKRAIITGIIDRVDIGPAGPSRIRITYDDGTEEAV
jgi:DNA invertase Pin-like site-specific DNA recombinase